MIGELFWGEFSLWNCAWQSTIFAVAGLVGSFILRHRSARAHQVLFLAMIAAVIAPMMSTLVKHYELGVFVAEPVVIQPTAEDWSIADDLGTSIIPAEDIEPKPVPTEGNSTPVIAGAKNAEIPWRSVLLGGWIAASLILAARLLVTFVRGVRLLGRASPLDCERIEQAVHIAKARLGIDKDVKVYSSRGVRSPVIWCWRRRPVLLVPSAAGYSDNEVDWAGVLCHELAHWKRRDHISGLFAELVVCILPWHPLLWWTKSRLISLSEQACDDWVVATGQPGTDYAESLLDLTPGGQMAFVPAVVTSKKGLAARIHRILKDKCGNPRTGAVWALGVSIVTACLTIGIACSQTRPAKTEPANQPPGIGQDKQNNPVKKSAKSLHEAAAAGDIEQVKSLISKGADVNSKDNRGTPALQLAAEKGHRDVVELLINKGADINAKSNGGRAAMLMAVGGGHKEVVELLVAKGADVNIENNWGWTPLHTAAAEGHKEIAEILIGKGANVNAKRIAGWTALHQAAAAGHRDIAELLIDSGADLNAKNSDGGTPAAVAMTGTGPDPKAVVELLVAKGAKVSDFHLAAYMGDIEKLKKYIQDGTDINLQDECNSTALHAAANSRKKEVVDFLINKGAHVDAKDKLSMTPLFYAAMQNHRNIVDLLLAKGADVNAKDEDGYTLLHHAIWEINKDAVELLINNGAKLNIKAGDGNTPLMNAIWMHNKEIVELLISKGADVNAEDKDGHTPLYWANMQDSKDIIELLTAKGAIPVDSIYLAAATGNLAKIESLIKEGTDINAKDKNGWTPLHWSANTGQINIAEFLIAKGANISARDERNLTPLQLAAERGQKDMAELLIDKGADINDKTRNGMTVLHIAADRGYKDMAELLILKGADVNAKVNWGATALHIAAGRGYKDVVELLIAHSANVDATNRLGVTPLGLAEENVHSEIAELLRKHGAKTSVGMENTPLHQAAMAPDIIKAQSLITQGADVNAKNKRGFTPLHFAARSGYTKFVKLLIDNGADVNAEQRMGMTPLHLAARSGHRDVVELLIANGANVNAKDRLGYSPKDLAEQKDNHEIVELLQKHGAKD